LDKRQQSSKLGKRTGTVVAQKLSVKPSAERHSTTKTDVKKGSLLFFTVCDTVRIIFRLLAINF